NVVAGRCALRRLSGPVARPGSDIREPAGGMEREAGTLPGGWASMVLLARPTLRPVFVRPEVRSELELDARGRGQNALRARRQGRCGRVRLQTEAGLAEKCA